ncbi:MAG TPA: DUF2235 domain-containing protein, partial [Chitinophagaceae bacterium]|nr:DUF2235 domain-containing protein [Chitinophagaceae bacterium]
KRGIFKAALWEQSANVNKPGKPKQRLEQVWFSGSHSNVGGGYLDARPSDVSLRWMIERGKECGLAFNDDYIESNISSDEDKCEGELRNSKTSFYRLSPDYIRAIGKAVNGYEDLHPSAVFRKDKKDNYQSANLIKALVNKGLRKLNGHHQ